MSGKAWDESTEYRLPEGRSPWEEPWEDEAEEDEWPEPTPQEREENLRELFGETDMTLEEMEAERAPGDVQTTMLEELDLEVGQEFMYLFDYGDEWRFKVRVHEINPDAPEDVDYPRVVESVGEAPEQYPRW